MIRVVIYLVAVGILAFAAVWLADRPGDVVITWQNRRIEMSVMVLAVGIVTIPAMIKSGFTRYKAAAIESVGSTGGQLMPPVMGAAAFIMAEFLQVSYGAVCVAAAIPAVLYYACLFIHVDLEAAKHGIGAAETLEGLCHMDGTNSGDVAADDDRWSRRQAREKTLHAPAKIALSLWQPTDPSPRRPKAPGDIAVRSNGEHRAPTPVARQSQRGMGEAAAIEAQRGDVADLAP